MLNWYETFVWVLWMIYYCDIMNVKLLQNGCTTTIKDFYCVIMNVILFWNVCTSITKDLLLCYKECWIDMKRLYEYYEWSTVAMSRSYKLITLA